MLNDKTGTQWAVEILEIQPSFLKKKILQGQKEGGGIYGRINQGSPEKQNL